MVILEKEKRREKGERMREVGLVILEKRGLRGDLVTLTAPERCLCSGIGLLLQAALTQPEHTALRRI